MKLCDPSLAKRIKNGQSAYLVAHDIINYKQDHSERWVFPGIKQEKKPQGNRAPTVTTAWQQTAPGWADAVVPQPGLHPQAVTHLCQRWNLLEITLTELPKQHICKTPALTSYPGKYKAVLTIFDLLLPSCLTNFHSSKATKRTQFQFYISFYKSFTWLEWRLFKNFYS